jgi:hypothetical protein
MTLQVDLPADDFLGNSLLPIEQVAACSNGQGITHF